ncbi:MAG: addiction module protein [Cyanobacteria bacterium J06648_11]
MDSILLREAALKLSPFERAQLIDALWQSLDPIERADIDRAWIEESSDRLSAFRRNEIQAIEGDRVLSELKETLSQRSLVRDVLSTSDRSYNV